MEKMASSSQLNQECDKLLKAARKKQGLTQWQLADRLGCQQPLVAKIERAAPGLTLPSSSTWLGHRRRSKQDHREVIGRAGCSAPRR